MKPETRGCWFRVQAGKAFAGSDFGGPLQSLLAVLLSRPAPKRAKGRVKVAGTVEH